MSELMVLLQALLLIAGWLLFLRAQTELRAQAARQSLTGELEELRQTIDALLQKLAEDAARAEARLEARLRELERYTQHALPTEPAPLIPTAQPKSVNAQASNPPSPRPSPPLSRGERAGSGGILHAQQFVNFDGAIGIIPTALPKSVDAHASNPPSPQPSPPLIRGERAGSGGILQAQELVDPVSATATTCQADSAPDTPAETLTPDSGYNLSGSATSPYGAVRMLAEQGLTIAEIARKTGYAPGEVELILNLTRHRTEENE
jgi:hypothetical protein